VLADDVPQLSPLGPFVISCSHVIAIFQKLYFGRSTPQVDIIMNGRFVQMTVLVRDRHLLPSVLTVAIAIGPSSVASAPQSTNEPGAPSGKTTIDGRYLPRPPQQFKGGIDPNAEDSKPHRPAIVAPHKDAPNILLIMTDDFGFSAPSTFGGVIPTPTLDLAANMGLRYTRFHTTALCSPTRAGQCARPSSDAVPRIMALLKAARPALTRIASGLTVFIPRDEVPS
jgi:Sulfatase